MENSRESGDQINNEVLRDSSYEEASVNELATGYLANARLGLAITQEFLTVDEEVSRKQI